MSITYRPSSRAKVKRAHQRAAYDQDSVFKILDAAQMINVGYVIEGQPYVTPTFHWRQGDTIFWPALRCVTVPTTAPLWPLETP